MRLQRYINEKWLEMLNNHDTDIFVNPSKKEIREILDGSYGFRYFMDFKKKKLYLFSDNIFHRNVVSEGNRSKVEQELGMNWGDYWRGTDKTIAYIIMGDCDKNMNNLNSDAFNQFEGGAESRNGNKAFSKLNELAKLDYTWLSKYGFSPASVRTMVLDTINYIDSYDNNKQPKEKKYSMSSTIFSEGES